MPLATDDLRDWIKTLEKHGELKRIREEVSPELEITEITDRVSKIGSRGGIGSTIPPFPRRARKGWGTRDAGEICSRRTGAAV